MVVSQPQKQRRPPVETRASAPRPNVVLSRPSTLVETPIALTSDGLLAGESISRYRGERSEKPAVSEEPLVAPASVHEHEPVVLQEEVAHADAATFEPAQEEAEPEIVAEAPVLEAAAVVRTEEDVHVSSIEDVQPEAVVEFEPEESLSASYRIDPSAPSEFRFAPASAVVEEEVVTEEVEATPLEAAPFETIYSEAIHPEPVAEVEHPSAPPADLRPESNELHAAPEVGAVELESPELDTDFDELEEEDEEDGSPAATGLVEEEEVTDEEEYDFTPLYS